MFLRSLEPDQHLRGYNQRQLPSSIARWKLLLQVTGCCSWRSQLDLHQARKGRISSHWSGPGCSSPQSLRCSRRCEADPPSRRSASPGLFWKPRSPSTQLESISPTATTKINIQKQRTRLSGLIQRNYSSSWCALQKTSSDTRSLELRLSWWWRTASSSNLSYSIVYYFLRCKHKENAGFGDDAELSQAAENCKEKHRLFASGTSDDLPLACDHFELEYAADLRTVAESLPTNACVAESATHNDVEIIGPGIGCQSLLQRGLHHIHPELPVAYFHERECAILVPVRHHLYNPLHCGHLNHDSLVCMQQSHASCQAVISRTTLLTYQFKRDKLLMMMINGIQQKRNRDILGIGH